ncbi:MAG: IclR family transcriptional regulator [Alphaproteobacteria bacterium]
MRTPQVRQEANPQEPAESSAAGDGSVARSATRLVALFEALATSEEGISLAELSATVAAPKSSLLGLLRSMVVLGYMEHGHGLYRLGPKAFRLAADILAVRRFPNLVRPILQELAAKSGETVFLVVLDRIAQRMTYADIIDSANPVRYTVPTGTTRPLYVSAGGQMLLAYQDPEWADAYIRATRLDKLTERTITDPEALRERLAAIRRDGFAISNGETVPGAAGVAAPIFNADGSVSAGLLIGAPIDRFEQEMPELKRLLREATARVSGLPPALVEEGVRRG